MTQTRPTLAYRLTLGADELPPYRYDEARQLSVDEEGIPAVRFPRASTETFAEKDPTEPGTHTRAAQDPGDAQYLGAEALVLVTNSDPQERPEPIITFTKAAADPGDPQATDLAARLSLLTKKTNPSSDEVATGAYTSWSDDLVTGIVAF